MQKFKSKKGFTLAELLIVVAIIAVLTAIAVPLFVGSLNKAEENVKNANIRAVRSVAVVAILNSEQKEAKKEDGIFKADGTLKETIYAKAYVTKTGDVVGLEFVTGQTYEDSCEKYSGENLSVTVGSSNTVTIKKGEDYEVHVKITSSDISGTNNAVSG